MIKELKNKKHIIRPYHMYVAVFDQFEADVPFLYKVLYNDFVQDLDISWSRNDAGDYSGFISNLSEIGIRKSDIVSISCELLHSNIAVDMRVQGFLNQDYEVINISNYLFSFFDRNDIGGRFSIMYSKMII